MTKPKINPKSFPAAASPPWLAWLVRVEPALTGAPLRGLAGRRVCTGGVAPDGIRPARSKRPKVPSRRAGPWRKRRVGSTAAARRSGGCVRGCVRRTPHEPLPPPGKPPHHTLSYRTFLSVNDGTDVDDRRVGTGENPAADIANATAA
jgi:hypothetical protein